MINWQLSTTEQLDLLFTYHPPTDETAPKYAAITSAEEHLHDAIFNALFKVREQHNTNPPAYVIDYDSVNAAARSFYEAIDANCPPSADKSAAFRCVILAKMCANRGLLNAAREIDTPIHRWNAADNMAHLAHEQAILAGLQAAKSIACGGR
jgi:hypothetical protein